MNTFLPYPSFIESASCLDNKRLGKQRVETWQIYNTIRQGKFSDCKICRGKGYYYYIFNDKKIICEKCKGKGKYKTAWYHHPITLMWKNYRIALLQYGIEICREWRKRGFKDTMLNIFLNEIYLYAMKIEYPFWLGDEEVHRGFRSNLLRKDYIYYSKFNWKEPLNLPYKWIRE